MNYSWIITVVLVAALFGVLWWNGQLVRLRDYIHETREEMRKCTWPTWAELKGSTIVVFITIGILGGFTVGVDWLFTLMVRWIT